MFDSSRDPFQRAQAQYQKQQLLTPAAAPPQVQAPQSSPNSMNALLQQPDQYKLGGQSDSFTSLLGKYGISNDGLQYNDMGKMQLQSRLSQKFGPGYEQIPDAQDILKSFDQYRSQLSQPSDDTKTQAAGDRTLAFLMGGQS